MAPVEIALYFILTITVINVSLLYRKVRAIERLLVDVSLDITLYEQLKRQSRESTATKRLIDKVGTWKK